MEGSEEFEVVSVFAAGTLLSLLLSDSPDFVDRGDCPDGERWSVA